MLCNPEKMPITEWPHPQIEQIRGVPAMTASTKLMESRSSSTHEDQQQQQQPPPPPQQQPLKCPRCDSSNTKFCYYNNYSLSQPRHFCKACKRYWTRGGTLRNVPVGGGCRKNKRVKRPPSAAAPSAADASAYGLPPSADMGGPLAGGFPANLRSLNMENMNINVVPNSSSNSSSGFDLPHLWMNFPAAVPTTTTTTSDGGDQYQYNPNPNPNHSSLLPDFSLLGSSASSILASCTLQNNPKVLGINSSTSTRPCNDFQVFFPMGGLHQNGGGHGNMNIKGVKMEEESMNAVLGNKMGTNWYENSMENNNMGSHHDSSVYWSNSSSGGMGAAAWPDHGTNYGSSITPLI